MRTGRSRNNWARGGKYQNIWIRAEIIQTKKPKKQLKKVGGGKKGQTKQNKTEVKSRFCYRETAAKVSGSSTSSFKIGSKREIFWNWRKNKICLEFQMMWWLMWLKVVVMTDTQLLFFNRSHIFIKPLQNRRFGFTRVQKYNQFFSSGRYLYFLHLFYFFLHCLLIVAKMHFFFLGKFCYNLNFRIYYH